MIGKGPGVKGAVWVAVRVPDDCISAHANQARIHQFPLNDKENCLYSPDRSEENTFVLQSHSEIFYSVFCLNT